MNIEISDWIVAVTCAVVVSGSIYAISLFSPQQSYKNLIRVEKYKDNIKKLLYIITTVIIISIFLMIYISEYFYVLLASSVGAFLIAFNCLGILPHIYIETKIKELDASRRGMLKKERTDIQWKFDDILGGGLALRHICLIKGPPGIGNTILSFEILYNGSKIRGQRGLFISMDDPVNRLCERLSTVWRDLQNVDTIKDTITIKEVKDGVPPYPYINWKRIFGVKRPAFSWDHPIYLILREYDKNKDLKRVAIDLPPLSDDIPKEQVKIFFNTLSKIAYTYDLLVVVTTRSQDLLLEQLAPVVINLNRKFLHDGRNISTLTIKKNVGFPSSPSEYEFEIRGMELEDSLRYKLMGLVYDEKTNKYTSTRYNKPIPGIWIFETSFKVGEVA